MLLQGKAVGMKTGLLMSLMKAAQFWEYTSGDKDDLKQDKYGYD